MIPNPDLTYEKILWPHYPLVSGLDEAGRGALAGPVCVGAVTLPSSASHLAQTLAGLRDSKQLTPLARESILPRIKESALAWGIGFASADEIDSMGIIAATRLAGMRALESMSHIPDYLLSDFRLELPELDIPQTALVKGDQKSLSIAAASVLAKTSRDALMRELDSQYPGYGFGRHKGYGTQSHRLALKRLGCSPLHRKTFKIKEMRPT